MKLKPKEQKQFDILAKAMDGREVALKKILAFEKEFGFVPAFVQADHRQAAAYEEYKRVGSWRDQPAVIKVMQATARLCAKNERKKGE